MKNQETVKHMVNHKKMERKARGKGEGISWQQLTLIGLGSVIGAGFFLGTGLSISISGPSVLIGYFIAGIAAFLAFASLSEMTVNDPQEGSFRVYARKAFGHRGGFVSGWMYWTAGVLIMSSEVTALSTFSRYWFHNIPLWVFASIYSVLGLGINLLGVKNFGKIESLFAIIKSTTLVIFILFGIFTALGWLFPSISPSSAGGGFPNHVNWFPHGFKGFWTGLLFVSFSFGGIAVVGIASNELRKKSEVPKACTSLLISLVGLYVLALFFVLKMVSWTKMNQSESPFIMALSFFHIPYMGSLFNAIVISASFSTMVGALFSITTVLLSLSNDGDAPKIFERKASNDVPIYALAMSGAALSATVFLSFLLPKTVYEYLTSAAGVMLLLVWILILLSQVKLRPHHADQHHFKVPFHPYSSYFGMLIIVFAISGAFLQTKERIGIYVAAAIVAAIYLAYLISFRFFHRRKSIQHQ